MLTFNHNRSKEAWNPKMVLTDYGFINYNSVDLL